MPIRQRIRLSIKSGKSFRRLKIKVVVIATRVGLGKVCLTKYDTAINQDLRAIIPKNLNELSVNYLYWWLKSIAHIIKHEETGATVKGVKLDFIKNLALLLPSLDKQNLIASHLEQLLNQVDQLELIQIKKMKALNELKQSLLQKAFTGELTANWRTKQTTMNNKKDTL
jgi:type I restriction enzyme S subunit